MPVDQLELECDVVTTGRDAAELIIFLQNSSRAFSSAPESIIIAVGKFSLSNRDLEPGYFFLALPASSYPEIVSSNNISRRLFNSSL